MFSQNCFWPFSWCRTWSPPNEPVLMVRIRIILLFGKKFMNDSCKMQISKLFWFTTFYWTQCLFQFYHFQFHFRSTTFRWTFFQFNNFQLNVISGLQRSVELFFRFTTKLYLISGLQRSHGRPSPLFPSLQRVRDVARLPQERLSRIQLSGLAGKMALCVRFNIIKMAVSLITSLWTSTKEILSI